uniref:Slc5a-4 n=1 Tax=Schmidtea mediterranea TaxID=79327 RepID=A0A0H3YIY3_SCHMD|nr:slc5a-4 [Schmidtea mediterranea]
MLLKFQYLSQSNEINSLFHFIMYQTLGITDYCVWALLLVSSLAIGFYFGYMDTIKRREKPNQSETAEFLLGSRRMSAFPVSCSIMASFFSAITLLGTPNEIYQYGVIYWYIGIGYIITIVISAYFFVPVFYNIGLTSSYQYLGKRFSKANQIMAATAFIIQMTPYMGIVLYGPSLALGIVVNVNIWIIIVSTAVICTIYTTVGGIKAVVWTDVLQLLMMFAGMLGIIIKGSLDAGGFKNIMKTAREHERMEINFSFDLRTRHSMWGVVIGGAFLWMGIYAINQTMIQRAISIRSLKEAYIAYLVNLPGMNLLLIIVVLCGFVLFHTFYGCDPLIVKDIPKSDQLVPLYVSKFLLQYPGLGGLFVAGIFSGGLSTMSSGLNSLAAVTLNDVIMVKYPRINDRTASTISKALVVVYGILTLIFAYLSSLTAKILEAALGLFGMLSGPTLGVFTLGMFFPFTNFKGAIAGHIVGQIIIFWIGFGAYANGIVHPRLALNNFNCSGKGNITIPTGHNITSFGKPIEGIQSLYAVSYIWYTFISWTIVLFVGILISLLTRNEKDSKIEYQYISPPLQKLWKNHLISNTVVEVMFQSKIKPDTFPSEIEVSSGSTNSKL